VLHGPPHAAQDGRLHLVMFLHGWNGCANSIVSPTKVSCKGNPFTSPASNLADAPARPGWDLASKHDRATQAALLVVPQLAFLARNSAAGRFSDPSAFDAFASDLFVEIGKHQPLSRTQIEKATLTLVAHSAGYVTALAILRSSKWASRVTSVVLFDALYGQAEQFAEWLAGPGVPGRKLISLYTGRATTYRENRRLAALVGKTRARLAVEPGGSLPDAIRTYDVVIAKVRTPHGAIPAEHYTEVIGALMSRPSEP
jgi:pimeloyl-ACP methyl ester carboxylesterase